MSLAQALILGLIEGLTEFLPVSSTGHMILASAALGLARDELWRGFLIIIQLGSILAVVFVFWRRLIVGLDLWLKLATAFIPTGLIGLLASGFLAQLFNGYVVVFMLILGGLAFILIEKIKFPSSSSPSPSPHPSQEPTELSQVKFSQAFLIGLAQSLAIIPGTSRSGASIIGGLLVGLGRREASEFSFLLALPTMIAATGYSLYKDPTLLASTSLTPLAVGLVAAFVVAILVIRLFLALIPRLGFLPFGIYRIVLGLVFFGLFYAGILDLGADF